MNLKQIAEARIVIDPEVANGKPRIKGTRVLVSDILLSLAEGLSTTEILRNFRGLQPDDLKAAIAYAFCLTDGIKMKIGTAFDPLTNDDQMPALTSAAEDDDKLLFSKALEEQAAIQEDITKEKLAELKAQKTKKTISPKSSDSKDPAPQERPYDLLIDISGERLTKVFKDGDAYEQGLDMSMDNYVLVHRKDNKPWLAYSTKDGVEVDLSMRRNLLVTYSDNGLIKKEVFEGYLTTDRQHKIFIQRVDGKTCGKVL